MHSLPPSPISSRASSSAWSGCDGDDARGARDACLAVPRDFHGADIHPAALRHVHIVQDSQSIKSSDGRPFFLSPYARDPWPPRYDVPLAHVTGATSCSAVFKSRQSAVNATMHIDGSAAPPSEAHVVPASGPFLAPTLGPGAPPTHLPPSPRSCQTSYNNTSNSNSNSNSKQAKLLPVLVQAKSLMSYVTLHVPHYPLTDVPLQLRARTLRRGCNVFLPPEFSGIVSWSLGVGQHGVMDPQQSNEERSVGNFRLSRGLAARGRVVDLTGRLGMPRSRSRRPTLSDPAATATAAAYGDHADGDGGGMGGGMGGGTGGDRARANTAPCLASPQQLHTLASAAAADADVKRAFRIHAPLLQKRSNRGLIKVYPVGTPLGPEADPPPPLRGDFCELLTARGTITLFDADEFEPQRTSALKKDGCIIS